MARFEKETFALVIENDNRTIRALRLALESHGIRARRVRTLREAEAIIQNGEAPRLVFTDVSLADGLRLQRCGGVPDGRYASLSRSARWRRF
jgi:DNA-binding NtrC family response regulator